MYQNKTISLIIPCYNEEKGLKKILGQVPSIVDEVIVVDNNSSDNSALVASMYQAKVVVAEVQGYGAAYQKGFSEAQGDIFVTMDADGMYPINSIPILVECLIRENVDFISLNRKPERIFDLKHFHRLVGNRILNWFIFFLFHIRLKDSQSGMWVFRKDVLNKIQLTSQGMAFSQEIKIEVFSKQEIKAKELAQIYYLERQGKSKLRPWKDGLANLLFLFRKRFSSI